MALTTQQIDIITDRIRRMPAALVRERFVKLKSAIKKEIKLATTAAELDELRGVHKELRNIKRSKDVDRMRSALIEVLVGAGMEMKAVTRVEEPESEEK